MSTKITRRHKATVFLEELSMFDTERENPTSDENELKDIFTNKSKHIGDLAPYIRIEQFSFSYSDIIYLEIDTSKFLPKIRVTLLDKTGAFGEAYFPKTNPILSVYIRSKNSNLLPIRNDYLITNIYPMKSGTSDERSNNINTQYSIMGELLVPKLNNLFLEGVDDTSFGIMESFAKKMELGFCSNIDSTNDKMVWLNNYSSYMDFLSKDVTTHAYSDENSFFNSFVDIFYNLNFINLYPMLDEESPEEVIEQAYLKTVDYLKTDAPDSPEFKGSNLLTNWTILKETSQYINGFAPITKQGKILRDNGYIEYVQYYNPFVSDDLEERFLLFHTQPYGIVAPDKTRNPNLEELYNNFNYDYRGIDYGNNHSNYKFAEYMHSTGMHELDKITVEVELNGINVSVIKNMQIPVLAVIEGTDPDYNDIVFKTQQNSKYKKLFEEIGLMIDKNYTGKYIIKNIKYVYDPLNSEDKYNFKTILTLAKNVWEPAPTIDREVTEELTAGNVN